MLEKVYRFFDRLDRGLERAFRGPPESELRANFPHQSDCSRSTLLVKEEEMISSGPGMVSLTARFDFLRCGECGVRESFSRDR